MASRIIHLAITDILTGKYPFKDINRLKIGATLPDASAPGQSTEGSHLKIRICGLTKKTYDLTRYRKEFGRKMKEDDLYLGYYLHLVQDILFRYFMYEMHRWDSKTPGNVDRIHNDYALINTYVVRKYQLRDDIVIPQDFADEPIHGFYPFGYESFYEDLKGDYEPYQEGSLFFFTEQKADAFIGMAVDFCLKELDALSQGKTGLDEYAWGWKPAWNAVPHSLLHTTLNTRELGGYRAFDRGRYTCMDAVWRSDVQKYPDEGDFAFLQEHHITTVIDMRGEGDALRAPSGFESVEGVTYCHVPIDEGSGIPESREAVPGSYMKIAMAKNMPLVFKKIATAPAGVMVNCTAGKDRTGVVSALLLKLCGVSDEDVVYDYLLTRECNQKRFELIHQNYPEVDMNIIIPDESYMREFLRLFKEHFETVEDYLTARGVTREETALIVRKMLG